MYQVVKRSELLKLSLKIVISYNTKINHNCKRKDEIILNVTQSSSTTVESGNRLDTPQLVVARSDQAVDTVFYRNGLVKEGS